MALYRGDKCREGIGLDCPAPASARLNHWVEYGTGGIYVVVGWFCPAHALARAEGEARHARFMLDLEAAGEWQGHPPYRPSLLYQHRPLNIVTVPG